MSDDDLLDRYMRSRATGDFAALRAVLADDLHFQDPLDTYDTADAFVASMTRLLSGPVRAIVAQRAVRRDGHAAIFSTWDTAVGSADFAEHLTITGGRVSRIQAYFDPRPFARGAGD
ncbi:nuclear transport factor 2 family protein [Spirillospora sp. CA-294931]|uniref:nuclear transport factor 2 family protein n=1 Tax=Spirillospora sp. CA-294931 TaxID=3240042 RepID=UPI003D8D18F2